MSSANASICWNSTKEFAQGCSIQSWCGKRSRSSKCRLVAGTQHNDCKIEGKRHDLDEANKLCSNNSLMFWAAISFAFENKTFMNNKQVCRIKIQQLCESQMMKRSQTKGSSIVQITSDESLEHEKREGKIQQPSHRKSLANAEWQQELDLLGRQCWKPTRQRLQVHRAHHCICQCIVTRHNPPSSIPSVVECCSNVTSISGHNHIEGTVVESTDTIEMDHRRISTDDAESQRYCQWTIVPPHQPQVTTPVPGTSRTAWFLPMNRLPNATHHSAPHHEFYLHLMLFQEQFAAMHTYKGILQNPMLRAHLWVLRRDLIAWEEHVHAPKCHDFFIHGLILATIIGLEDVNGQDAMLRKPAQQC